MPRLTEAQRIQRRGYVGSSDVAALMGVSPYVDNTPFALWLEKRGELPDDYNTESTPEQELGHELEAILVGKAAAELKIKDLVRPTESWEREIDGVPCGASLDGFSPIALVIFEAKNVGLGMHDGWEVGEDDGVPLHVQVQAQWQMLVRPEFKCVYVSALVLGRWRIFLVPPDRELQAKALAAAKVFWAQVRSGTRPNIDDSEAAAAWLRHRFPGPGEVSIMAMSEASEAQVREHVALAGELARIKEKRDSLGNAIRAAIGEANADGMQSLGLAVKATWKLNKAGQRTLLTSVKEG